MEHYFSEKQTSPFKLKRISAVLRNKTFEFYTAPGVFSKSRVDLGTRVLVEKCIVKDGWRVLDLGCGYGVVGIVIKKLFPNCEVVMSDINERALKLSMMNAKLNKVEVSVVKSFLFENLTGVFDAIIVNPPQAAGLKLCYSMIDESYSHLKIKGLLELVARHKKGGSRLEHRMLEVFGNVMVKKSSGYRVYISKKEDEVVRIAKKLTKVSGF